ncbi:TPA: protein-disulfide isomerase [Campylobacter jejuni]|uniref:protein-disulfide isomerase n=1 Tax=Campylobacter jejuni TaxID=197 RepID=UPI0013A41F27|nr:protein-disulfide isomerase [Campylobacter jejuni]EDP8081156.1 protein-disulfide isomerase [Campylobacter jejuni]EHN6930085.1 protein-disulfide isomerase [Campylobacter jejuni]HED7558543.1 protein-disulfide isomerase [Campylobacter jejuni]HEF4628983.1 protein-disulfide isomerase [Campylobacter jejuni]
MKFPVKLARSIVVCAFLAGISASALSEGKEYVILKNPIANADNSLIEIFSYRCTHCYDHHKFNTMGKVKEKLPNLTYKFYPVSSMGDYERQANEIFAFAAFKDGVNKIDPTDKNSLTHKVAEAYFNAYFKKKQRWENGKNPEAFYSVGLKAMNVSKADFENFLKTPEALIEITKELSKQK